MDDYEPQFDQRPHRARRPENETDDAWSAAEEDDLAEPDVEIEDLAAGYEWNDPDFLANEPVHESPVPRRPDSSIAADPLARPPAPPSGGSYDPARGYPSQGPVSSEPQFDPYHPPTRPDMPADQPNSQQPGCLSALPLWGIVLIVVLALLALGALVLAFELIRVMTG